MSKINVQKEARIESFLRNHKWILFSVTFIVSSLLYLGIYYSMTLYNDGKYWSLLLSGLFAHSFFVITMHDGAHQSITETKLDALFMTLCSGLIILPGYTELFKKYHLTHHAETNTSLDPLWSPAKEKLFNEYRKTYAFLQCLPFVFNIYVLFQKKTDKVEAKSYQPKWSNFIFSLIIASIIIYFFEPPFLFIFGTFTVMTTLGAFRYWGEHMGIEKGKESNTHWFPLGMGIGNHDVHHHYPNYSWLTLTIGLLYRKTDTNPFKSFWLLLTDSNFHHYKPKND